MTSTSRLGVATYGLRGELDVVTARQVRELLSGAHAASSVLLDLNDVTGVDVAGVGALLEVIHDVHRHGGRVAVARPWRLAVSLLGLIGAPGLVFLALSPIGAVTWLNDHLVKDRRPDA